MKIAPLETSATRWWYCTMESPKGPQLIIHIIINHHDICLTLINTMMVIVISWLHSWTTLLFNSCDDQDGDIYLSRHCGCHAVHTHQCGRTKNPTYNLTNVLALNFASFWRGCSLRINTTKKMAIPYMIHNPLYFSVN